MNQYLALLDRVMTHGTDRPDRTGTGTRALFGERMEFDLQAGFPLLTTKKLPPRVIFGELLWFLSGSTSARELREKYGVTIWDEWADERGELGPIYGKQWRSWWTGRHIPKLDKDGHEWHVRETIDQIANVVDSLKNDPFGRRHVVSTWNVGELDAMSLPPCHCLFQFFVRPIAPIRLGVPSYALDCQLYQRSADIFLGVPFNIASYAALTHMVAQVVGMAPGRFVHALGDVHLYHNHFEQAREQLSRTPGRLPTLRLNPEVRDIDGFTLSDLEVIGYEPAPHLPAPVAV